MAPTDMTEDEFEKANVCKSACARGLSCKAKWSGSWSCGGEGDAEELELTAEDGVISEDFAAES